MSTPSATPPAADRVDTPTSDGAAGDSGVVPGSRLRLFALCFTMLFLELALIRWTGANVIYVSYFSNLVLLGAFLGIGVGFLRAGRGGRSWIPATPIVLGLYVLFVSAVPVEVDAEENGIIFFGGNEGTAAVTGLPIWLTLPVVFASVALVMSGLGEAIARVFGSFRPLQAYRLDILGSLLGIIAFSTLSLLGAPPIVWGAVVALLLLALVIVPGARGGDRNRRAIAALQVFVLGAMLVALAGESRQEHSQWSPYYEIEALPFGEGRTNVAVNGLPHQLIESIEQRREHEPFYFTPYDYRVPGSLDRVLVVGAGNGTDVAIALQNGARHVDAVEIDPLLQRLGRERHPDKPYQDARVEPHITDGRAFLEQTNERYDLIVFALPDSLTLVSGQSSLRLESYLFTVQAIREARRHLTDDGTFAMYNYYRRAWLVDRFAGTLDAAFGHPPCVQRVSRTLAVLVASKQEGADRCPALHRWKQEADTPAPATDDHPFPYLRTPSIPSLYLATLGMVLAASLLIVRQAAGGLRQIGRYADLFLMGVAFLLLETKNVVQFALLFGTTWIVNALVFAAILVAVLVAIEIADRWRVARPGVLYVLLLASLAVGLLVDSQVLLQLSFWPRFIVAGAIAFTPIVLANLIFADRFRDTSRSTIAFGANLLGAMVGGVLEYAALVTGYRGLLVAVALLYVLAFVAQRRLTGRAGNAAVCS